MENKKTNMNIKKQTKKAAIGLLVLGQIMTTGALAAPQEAISAFKDVKEIRQDIGHFKGEIKLFIEKDGKKTRVDQNMKDGLRVVEGRTCVGVRDLVNAIEGAEVEWDQVSKIVDIKYDGKTISYPLGKPVMWDGDKMVTIDVPAQVDPQISRTFLPIRNIAETLGFKVDWNQKTKEVTLTQGASTGQTTTTQTTQQPKANTNTNTENLSWVTASGQKIPRANELPSDPSKMHSIKIKREDVTQNPDGTTTYFKGTPLEFTRQAKFKYVKKSPEWGGFNLFGPSGNDPRVGLASFQEGHPVYDRWKADRMAKYPDEFDPYPFMPFMPMHKVVEEYPNREISYDIINQIPNKLKMDKSDYNIDYLIDDLNKKLGKWYDFTGILDMSITGVGDTIQDTYNIMFGGGASFIITTDGELISSTNLLNYKDKIADKVIQTSQDYKFIVDIPNIRIGDYIDKIKYTEGTYFINSYKVVNLHK